MELIVDTVLTVARTALDVVPIALFIIAFQIFVLRRPLLNPGQLLAGFILVVIGLGLFLVGLEQALFPLGRLMAEQLTHPELMGTASDAPGLGWTDYYWVYIFAFAIGFSTAIAEPALLAVAMKANEVSGGAVSVRGLRVAVALGVAIGVAVGCLRIVTGTPLHFFIISGYFVVVLQTAFAPKLIVPLAYDSGGVATSTVTVPLITALGLGLAQSVPDRSPLLDGFGLVAFASLFAIISVLAYAQFSVVWAQRSDRAVSKSNQEEDNHAL
jgi:hypothetical protein